MLACKRIRPLRDLISHSARYEAQNLQLPFLCPALLTSDIQRHAYSRTTQPPNKQRNATTLIPPPNAAASTARSRGLASAATAEIVSPFEDIIPFDGLHPRSAPTSQSFGPEYISPLTGFDPSTSPLILNNVPTTRPDNFRAKYGIGGHLSEIHQIFDACLRVGQFDRAAMYLGRMDEIYKPHVPALLDAYKDYVREVTGAIIRTNDMNLLTDLQAMFEKKIKCKDHLRSDGAMLALMVQACLQIPDTGERDDKVEQYMEYASQWGVQEEVQALLPQLVTAVQLGDEPLGDAESWTEETSSDSAESLAKEENPVNSPPVLRPVDIKGPGMATLRRSLDSVTSTAKMYNDQVNSQGEHQVMTATDRQRDLERNTVKAAIERWKIENEGLMRMGINNSLSDGAPLGAVLWQWHQGLVSLIRAELEMGIESRRKPPSEYSSADRERLLLSPFLSRVSPEKASAATIMAVMTIMCSDKGSEPRLSRILQSIVDVYMAEAAAEDGQDDQKLNRWRSLSQSKFQKSVSTSVFARLGIKAKGSGSKLEVWPQAVQFKLAAMLLSRLTKAAKVEVTRHDQAGQRITQQTAAFFHTFTYERGKRLGTMRLHPLMHEQISSRPLRAALAKHLPMLCEPRPWEGLRDGGFLEHKELVARIHGDSLQRAYLNAAAENGDLSQVYRGLNVLGQVPWNINRAVFEVMAEAWNLGETIANFPADSPKEEYPPEPDRTQGARTYYDWVQKVKSIKHRIAGLRSERSFMNFQLEIARTFLDETFYFPHNLDFRGRVYPMAPFLNHMGADHARGLLCFAEGRELGPNGLSWLKIHLANCYGYDKASFSERSEFAELHIDDASDSALDPLGGRRWWLEAEDPWQCLATCFELHQALQLPDPCRYISHIPIHTDGTCNGLQHYAALGGDKIGAQQVNLEPGDRPSDVYTAVAEMVKSEIYDEASQGNATAQILDGRISRKVVKQTVMTNVYGVTVIGAERQIARQLKDIFAAQFREGDENIKIMAVSNYVAKKIFKSLGDMFTGARDIQGWFGQCATMINESLSTEQLDILEGRSDVVNVNPDVKRRGFGRRSKTPVSPYVTPVIWTTPLKMPVVQPYRKLITRDVETEFQNVDLMSQDEIGPIHKKKQLQAFPPNFIHSLDGTHMFLTAMRCKELGLTFASVHDSFWTHACDVDTLNKVTRDAFIRMHSEDIVRRLHAEFSTRYKGHIRLTYVPINSRVGRAIQQFRHDNSDALHKLKIEWQSRFQGNRHYGDLRFGSEIILEAKRLRLLRSKDPAEREAGEAMVTPATIFASMADETTLPPAEPATMTVLGKTTQTSVTDLDAANAETAPGAASEEKAKKRDQEPEPADQLAEESSSAKPKAPPKATKKPVTRLSFWAPLAFPAVPAKGEFDITRLKDSRYFFS